jgi:hypothetical protein
MRAAITLIFLIIVWTSSKAQQKTFDFKYDDNGIDKINTFNNTFKRSYIDSIVVIEFKLTEGEQEIISDYAMKLGLHKIKAPIRAKKCGTVSFPALTYQLEFLNDKKEIINLIWGNNDCDDKTIKKLQTFVGRVHKLILSKEEFKNLKETDILLL